MIATVVLLGLVSVCVVTDVWRRKIYNWITYPGMLVAFAGSGLGSALVAAGVCGEGLLERLGWIPIGESLLGFLACGAIMLVCFVFFRGGVGGGDVKLIAMMGAFLGVRQGFEAMLWTFVFGGCAGVIVLVWRIGPSQLFFRLMMQLFWIVRLGGYNAVAPKDEASAHPPLFLAPCALLATIVVRFSLVTWIM